MTSSSAPRTLFGRTTNSSRRFVTKTLPAFFNTAVCLSVFDSGAQNLEFSRMVFVVSLAGWDDRCLEFPSVAARSRFWRRICRTSCATCIMCHERSDEAVFLSSPAPTLMADSFFMFCVFRKDQQIKDGTFPALETVLTDSVGL